MLGGLLRAFLITVGATAEWLIARDSLRWQLIEICLSLVPVIVILLAAAFWPAHWSAYLGKFFRRSR